MNIVEDLDIRSSTALRIVDAGGLLAIEIASLVVSIVALVASIVAANAAIRLQRTQTRVQERLFALEGVRERARIREGRRGRLQAELVRHGRGHGLLIQNVGSGTARDIQVRLDAQALSEHTLWVGGQDEVTILGPGGSASYLLAFAMGKPTSFDGAVLDVVSVGRTLRDLRHGPLRG